MSRRYFSKTTTVQVPAHDQAAETTTGTSALKVSKKRNLHTHPRKQPSPPASGLRLCSLRATLMQRAPLYCRSPRELCIGRCRTDEPWASSIRPASHGEVSWRNIAIRLIVLPGVVFSANIKVHDLRWRSGRRGSGFAHAS